MIRERSEERDEITLHGNRCLLYPCTDTGASSFTPVNLLCLATADHPEMILIVSG